MLQSIIIPTDLGPDSASVVRFAAGLSRIGIKRALLAHVVEASGMEGPVIAHSIDKARAQLAGYADPLKATGIDVELRVVTGDPANEIVVLGEHSNVDVLVCGTHAKTALTKLFSGSVSEDILARSSQPALLARYDVLRKASDAKKVGEDFARKLVVPIDFSASSTRAALAVTQLPPEAVGTVVLVHVVDPSVSAEQFELAKQGAEFQLASLCTMLTEAGMTAQCVVRKGEPTKTILAELKAQGATGVVTGTRGHTGFQEAVLGSTSMALIRQGSCPVMIVP